MAELSFGRLRIGVHRVVTRIERLDDTSHRATLAGGIDTFDDDEQARPDDAIVGLAAEMQAELVELLLRDGQATFVLVAGRDAARDRGRPVVPCRVERYAPRAAARTNPPLTTPDRYGEPLHVREDLRHHQRRRRPPVGRDGGRCGRLRLRPFAATDRGRRSRTTSPVACRRRSSPSACSATNSRTGSSSSPTSPA